MNDRRTLDEIDALGTALPEQPASCVIIDPRRDTQGRPGKPYDADIYDESYYLRGKETGKSLYTDYRWMEGLTIPMCRRIVEHCGIRQGETILDFGCARGYVVKALRRLGYAAEGIDVSEWAIGNCDEEVRGYVSLAALPQQEYDWILAKDVLEHLDSRTLSQTLTAFGKQARRGVFIVVPLSDTLDAPYVIPEYEQDVTHVQRMSLLSWYQWVLCYFGVRWSGKVLSEWDIKGQYLVEGIKQNWSHFPTGNGFITAWRKEG